MSTLLPRYIQILSMLLAGTVTLLAIWLPLNEPWLGIRLGVEGGIVVVAEVSDTDSPVLAVGTRISGVGTPGAQAVSLSAESFIDTPGYLRRFVDYRNFFFEQRRLTELRSSPEAVLHLTDGRDVVLPWRARGLATLNFVFWFQLACALLAFSVAASVLAYRPADRAAWLYFLLGIGCLLIGAASAVMRARMLSIDADWFRAVHVANHVGVFTACAAEVGFLASYPRRLVSPWIVGAVFGAYAMLLLADIGQWVDSIDIAFRAPLLGTAIPCVGLLLWQWRASRNDPLARAALKWILFSFGISLVLVFANDLRTMLGVAPLLPSGYNTALTLFMFVGVAVGIRRSALFNLEPWWLEAWIWLIGGLAVVVVDVLLVTMLKIGDASALAASLLICGWIYFPARQAVLARTYGQQKDVSAVFPDVVEMLLAGPVEDREFNGRWRALLRRLFAPQDIVMDSPRAGEQQVRVMDDGLRLLIPAVGGLGGGMALVLEYAAGGARLFTRRDEALMQSIWNVVARGLSAQAQFARGAQSERERIAHDLHDDLGARLLTLIHRASTPADADIARAAMQDLRTLVSSLDSCTRLLAEAVADWRAEAGSRCEAAGVQLCWREDIDAEGAQPMLNPHQRVNLERLVREALTNSIRHAGATCLDVDIAYKSPNLRIAIRDDGIGLAPDRWRQGRGTLGMERRARDIGGRVSLKAVLPTGTEIVVSLRLSETT